MKNNKTLDGFDPTYKFHGFLDRKMNKLSKHYLLFILCFFIVGCGSSPEIIFSKAVETFKMGKYRQAYRSFNQIVKKHDNWDRINEAKEYLENYSFKLYSRAETLRNEKEYKMSIDALSYVVEHFGQSDIAPKSQYLIGDIFMNDLKKHSEATSCFW